MSGLLIKDILVITKQLKIFLIAIPVMAITGGGSMATLAILMGSVLPMTAIAYDERSKWNEIAVMMPYSKRDIVISKYFLGYLCMLGAATLVITVQFIIALIGRGNITESISMLLIALASGFIFIAINTPILFQFGSEKGRYVFIIAIAFAAGLGPIMKNFDSAILLSMVNTLPVFLLAFAAILNLISIFISMRIKIK